MITKHAKTTITCLVQNYGMMTVNTVERHISQQDLTEPITKIESELSS